jgi:hypothetical protein
LRNLLGITKLDNERNQCIRQKTGAQNTVKEIKQYQKKWLQRVQRMETNRLPNQALQYKPKGRRNIGRPRKRWRANFILRIKEQETRLTLQEHDDDGDNELWSSVTFYSGVELKIYVFWEVAPCRLVYSYRYFVTPVC